MLSRVLLLVLLLPLAAAEPGLVPEGLLETPRADEPTGTPHQVPPCTGQAPEVDATQADGAWVTKGGSRDACRSSESGPKELMDKAPTVSDGLAPIEHAVQPSTADVLATAARVERETSAATAPVQQAAAPVQAQAEPLLASLVGELERASTPLRDGIADAGHLVRDGTSHMPPAPDITFIDGLISFWTKPRETGDDGPLGDEDPVVQTVASDRGHAAAANGDGSVETRAPADYFVVPEVDTGPGPVRGTLSGPWAPGPHIDDPVGEAAPLSLWVLTGATVAGAAGIVAVYRIVRFLGVGLYAHVDRDAALRHPARQQVLEYLRENPGARLHEICQHLQRSRGAVTYHLDVLVRNGLAHEVKVKRTRHFYHHDVDVPPHLDAVLSHRRRRRIAAFVARHPGTIQKQICSALGIRANRASEQIDRLQTAGLIAAERHGRTVRYHATPALENILERA